MIAFQVVTHESTYSVDLIQDGHVQTLWITDDPAAAHEMVARLYGESEDACAEDAYTDACNDMGEDGTPMIDAFTSGEEMEFFVSSVLCVVSDVSPHHVQVVRVGDNQDIAWTYPMDTWNDMLANGEAARATKTVVPMI